MRLSSLILTEISSKHTQKRASLADVAWIVRADHQCSKIVLSLRDSPEQWWKSYRDTLIPFAVQFLPNGSWQNTLYRAFLPRLPFDE